MEGVVVGSTSSVVATEEVAFTMELRVSGVVVGTEVTPGDVNSTDTLNRSHTSISHVSPIKQAIITAGLTDTFVFILFIFNGQYFSQAQ